MMLEAVAESVLTAEGDHRGEGADQRIADLGQIIQAYNQVTENLQKSHEALRQEVVRLQAELASTNAQLQRSKRLAALGEMAAGIAHEIRNPLGAIHLYAGFLDEDLEALADGSLSDEPGEVLARSAQTARKIASAVHGLDAIVNDVLSFSREIKPRQRQVLVEALLVRALEAQRPQIDAAGIDVHLNVAEDARAVVVDVDLMHQALVNLIRNATDAMKGESDPRRLTLTSHRDHAQVVLTLADTGPGIAEEAIDRIFNPFFTTRNTGTGLGLAIVHRIIDAHAGTIAVRNEAGERSGAVFELSLPGEGPRAEGHGPRGGEGETGRRGDKEIGSCV